VTPEERRRFVRDHRTAIFGYNRRNDGPAMTVVYYLVESDDELLVSTMAERAKAKAVRRDPRVSLCVLDEQWPLTYLQVYGTATVDDDHDLAVDVLRRILEVMAGTAMPSSTASDVERMVNDEQRVVVRFKPYATFATPPRHVHRIEDVATLTHWTSRSQPW
jgi:PPOX class probable F420-dependent enzyme